MTRSFTLSTHNTSAPQGHNINDVSNQYYSYISEVFKYVRVNDMFVITNKTTAVINGVVVSY